ncbi:MAG: tRNA pseudouridine(55) synthase TruB [Alphaproteobacteria bacterium]|nr:tRNA pseudouridine(55) synthase TruB [Alphaproteobacteria bacterium]
MKMTSGWIILDKDSGLFSRTAGGRIARMLGTKKFGHIGTLDPMATGVLPIAIGDATKMIPFVEDVAPSVKEYLFSCQFGFETDTLDITGHEIARTDVIPPESVVLAALESLRGSILQIPPMYSAVHIDGVRAHELARRGRAVEIPPRCVEIYELEFMGRDGASWHFRTVCSRGTYVRSLARDIAAKCGTIATVDMIRRIKTNGFDIKDAVKLDFLEKVFNNSGNFGENLKPIDFGLGDIPVLNLSDKDADFYRNGGFVRTATNDGLHRIYTDDQFIGIGVVSDGVLRPKRTI